MVDEYIRGWDDCLEAVSEALAKNSDIEAAKQNVTELQKAIKKNKLDKIRFDLCLVGLV